MLKKSLQAYLAELLMSSILVILFFYNHKEAHLLEWLILCVGLKVVRLWSRAISCQILDHIRQSSDLSLIFKTAEGESWAVPGLRFSMYHLFEMSHVSAGLGHNCSKHKPNWTEPKPTRLSSLMDVITAGNVFWYLTLTRKNASERVTSGLTWSSMFRILKVKRRRWQLNRAVYYVDLWNLME